MVTAVWRYGIVKVQGYGEIQILAGGGSCKNRPPVL